MSHLEFGLLIFFAMTFAPAKQETLKERTGDTDAPPTVVEAVPKPTPKPTPPSNEPQTIQKRLITTFQSYVGIKEEPLGSNCGPMVNLFNASCGFTCADHAPWCASCAHYGYKVNGLKGRGAYSPSWFDKHRLVDRNAVGVADVALVFFPSKGRFAHTIAAVEKVTTSVGRTVQVSTLEGNTNSQGDRNGDRFARRIRPADSLTYVRWWNQ